MGRLVTTIAGIALLLGGCGLKGDLYLEDDVPAETVDAPATDTPAAADGEPPLMNDE